MAQEYPTKFPATIEIQLFHESPGIYTKRNFDGVVLPLLNRFEAKLVRTVGPAGYYRLDLLDLQASLEFFKILKRHYYWLDKVAPISCRVV